MFFSMRGRRNEGGRLLFLALGRLTASISTSVGRFSHGRLHTQRSSIKRFPNSLQVSSLKTCWSPSVADAGQCSLSWPLGRFVMADYNHH